MRRRRLGYLGVVCLALLAGGCGFIPRVITKNIGAWGDEPRKVPNKLLDPRRPEARLAVLWIGHATALIQMDDAYVLTDPVFTHNVGQVSPRLVEPGIAPENVPALAVTAISHMHFDHLSFDSLAAVEDQTEVLLVPPGVKSSVPRYDFEIRELGGWQRYERGGFRATAVPVRHVGGRYGIDAAWKRQAFTGYVFEYRGLSVYYGGDTAFDAAVFRATRERFPKLDLALLPICPAEPRDYMKKTHVDPAEALDAFLLLGAKQMVPVHYDTFISSDDPPGECERRLRREMAARNLGDDRVVVLAIGEQRVLLPR